MFSEKLVAKTASVKLKLVWIGQYHGGKVLLNRGYPGKDSSLSKRNHHPTQRARNFISFQNGQRNAQHRNPTEQTRNRNTYHQNVLQIQSSDLRIYHKLHSEFKNKVYIHILYSFHKINQESSLKTRIKSFYQQNNSS